MIQLNLSKSETKVENKGETVHTVGGYFELKVTLRKGVKFNPSDLKIELGSAYFAKPRPGKKKKKKRTVKIKPIIKERKEIQ